MRILIATVKMSLFLLWTAILVPLQILVKLLFPVHMHYGLPHLYHRGVCLIFCLRYDVTGAPQNTGQRLFMATHLSYLDIPVLGAVIRNASFVAKSEVEHWPLFGFLSKLQNTEFINRRTSQIKNERDKIAARVAQNHSLIMFPEATSSDGITVKPFKSSLFSVLEDTNIHIYPITITLQTTNEKSPATTEERRIYTWPLEDDIEVPAHLWRLARSKGACVSLTFHPPITPSAYADRKALAKACENSVSIGL